LHNKYKQNMIISHMLNKEITKKINDFVYQQPRTIQEISQLIKKNWRTADRYIEQMKEEEGNISTKTFRGGTKGALKIVYWCNIDNIHRSTFQEHLFKQIESSKHKEDFSPFEIFQHIEEKKRHAIAWYENSQEDALEKLLKTTEKEILCFSGNLSWVNIKGFKNTMETLVKNNVQIKVLTRIDIASISNINKLLEIEKKFGKKCIDIRHCEQPLRGFIFDERISRLTEIKSPSKYKTGELKKEVMLDYEIKDAEWVEWLTKIFYHFFRNSISYEKRIHDLNTIEKLKP